MPRPRLGVPDMITAEMRLRNAAKLAQAQLDVNGPKDKLMVVVRQLDRDGLTEDAKRLDRIIQQLEAWQNRK